MIKRKLRIMVLFLIIGLSVCFAQAEEYNPPFELSGIVMSVSENSLEVHLPYINKQVEVNVQSKTKISNRLKEKNIICQLSEISAQDLVIIKGVVKNEAFLSTEISFLPN